ncbi:acylneuraminate cytidylyltransferase [Pseudovibrio brasiliensis]|uniref:N-acylneuraminate cytidylyltransferase n=1 Tax=Pseudovibrio brasiliensis TaxID=1898042 RepID=A0ABX8AMK6_9HYPH|nr:acylneuraminate cytidylyltransferase [Pseudovibrio brasiliensis]QUS54891.1 acylneuraminate cytidylyltransferase [Pseudovibrio brasiliensis]
MNKVAIIPARGGSVGLPGKNIKPLQGVPLVARAVLAAKKAKCIDRIIVSSDCVEILDVASKYGAEPLVRPSEISNAFSSSENALIHAVEQCNLSDDDVLVFLQCTSPFTMGEEIDKVVATLGEKGVQSAFSAVEDHSFIWEVGTDGLAKGITHNHRLKRPRRQDVSKRYRENGAIYAMRVGDFKRDRNRFCGKTILVPVDAPCIEVDTIEDWHLAEAIAESRTLSNAIFDRNNLLEIKALVMDFDGVHTDDAVYVNQDGIETVKCSRSDGFGLEQLRNAGLRTLILSKEENSVVKARAFKLKIDVLQNVSNKVQVLECWLAEHGLKWDDVAYFGNDINDLKCMQKAGVSVAPQNAHQEVKKIASIVVRRDGGNGAIREFCDQYLRFKST